MQHVVRESYFGEDVLAEAQRFARSDECVAVLTLLGLNHSLEPKVLLDVGCGNGIASYAFAQAGHCVIAMDCDESDTVGLGAVHKLSRQVEAGSILPAGGVAEGLPLRDSVCDIVYARQVLHHFRNLDLGMRECARVLRPGGMMIATREHVADDARQLEAFLADHPLHALYGGENAFRLDEYLGAGQCAGLELQAALGPYDSVVNWYPATYANVRSRAVGYLSRKIGRIAAEVMLAVPAVRDRYFRRMSRFDRTPGRLYTFLWRKPLRAHR
jgi:2-polyprenyl-3-methyl-5-hydroxy-6-metoxy-1,4-benzoquinol methylase